MRSSSDNIITVMAILAIGVLLGIVVKKSFAEKKDKKTKELKIK